MARTRSDTVAVMVLRSVIGAACLAIALGAPGCGDDDQEEQAPGEAVSGDALQDCLAEEGLDVERGEPAPIRFNAGPVTPQAGLVVSPDASPRSEILVLDPEDAASYDQSLPAGFKDPARFGTNVVVLVTAVVGPGPVRGPKVPADVRRALNACVS